MPRPSNRRLPSTGPDRGGFTLVELLIVFVILALLIALLLPAINGAVRTAKNTAASTELKQLDQALAAFKSKYGDYPPSRILLCENGYYNIGLTTALAGATPATQADITYGQLAQRSLSYLRKFFPKVVLSTSGAVWTAADNQWYDFNGNGVLDPPYILQGHQALVFFLGGLPQSTSEGYAMTGFAKNPANPFTPAIAGAAAPAFFSNNREQPLYEFKADRLLIDTVNTWAWNTSNIPGYLDNLGNTTTDGGQVNFIAYFSAYGSNAYDPNDVNFAVEEDGSLVKPILSRVYVRFPVYTNAGSTNNNVAVSPSPNPYTSTITYSTTPSLAATITYINPQTYQLISSGMDGQYGPGGQFKSNNASEALPFDAGATISTDKSVRQREKDNLTNFRGGRLD